MEVAVLAHWHQRIEGFNFSSQEFYQRLRAKLEERQYPQLHSYTVVHPEGGAFTPNREYLRITRQGLNFDICAAPFGIDFFVSWWLLEKPGCLSLLLGGWLSRKTTYYQEDTAIVFREAVHDAVVAVLTDILGDRATTTLQKSSAPTVAKSPLV